MKFSDALKSKGVFIGLLMIVLGLYMTGSAAWEQSSLKKQYPLIDKSSTELHQMRMKEILDTEGAVDKDMQKELELRTKKDVATLHIRYSRAGMSYWAGIVIFMLGIGVAVIYFFKEKALHDLLKDDDPNTSG